MDDSSERMEGLLRQGARRLTGHQRRLFMAEVPAKRKWTPLGILVLTTAALTLIFGTKETSDFWVDGLKHWWRETQAAYVHVRQVVIYLDNGPNNAGTRTQFLKRMIEFADWSGLQIRLVYYPPYHSKYNLIERCWSALDGAQRVSAHSGCHSAQRVSGTVSTPPPAQREPRSHSNSSLAFRSRTISTLIP